MAKSGSFKEERLAKEDLKIKTGSDTAIKSPKLSRTESMTERTVQKISKIISKSESGSKIHRKLSSSSDGEAEKEKSDKAKEEKKSAHEKREMFKSKQLVDPSPAKKLKVKLDDDSKEISDFVKKSSREACNKAWKKILELSNDDEDDD